MWHRFSVFLAMVTVGVAGGWAYGSLPTPAVSDLASSSSGSLAEVAQVTENAQVIEDMVVKSYVQRNTRSGAGRRGMRT
jgi:hypothetical protein